MHEDESQILEEAKQQMDIVPYTKRDRTVTYLILIFVLANFITLMLAVPWGSIF